MYTNFDENGQLFDEVHFKEDQLLLLLNTCRCLNVNLVYEFFDFPTTRAAYMFLYRLEKKGYLYNVPSNKYNGSVFFLTNKGIEAMCVEMQLPFFEIVDGERKNKFYTQYDNKVSPKLFPHSLGISQFFLTIMKLCNKNNTKIEWYEERECMATNENNQPVLQSDARFNINGRTYILEHDMGTERVGALKTKMTRYCDYLSQSFKSVDDYPCIVFNVHKEFGMNDRQIDHINKSCKVLKSRYSKLKKERIRCKKLISEKKKITVAQNAGQCTFFNPEVYIATSEEINDFIKELIPLKHQKFASDEFKMDIAQKINELEDIRNSNLFNNLDLEKLEASLKEIEDSLSSAEAELKSQKTTSILKVLEKIHRHRIDVLTTFFCNPTEEEPIYSLLENGMDIYINDFYNNHRMFMDIVQEKENRISNLIEYVSNKLSCGAQDSIVKASKNVIHEKLNAFTCDGYVSDGMQEFVIFDVSYNNVGAKVRLEKFLEKAISSKNRHVVILCKGQHEYAQKIRDEFSGMFNISILSQRRKTVASKLQ